MDTNVSEDHGASIFSVEVDIRMQLGYIGSLQDDGHSDAWEGKRRWSLIQANRNGEHNCKSRKFPLTRDQNSYVI
jgi:hypothetical protein